MFPLIGSLVGAGANLLGGLMGQQSNQGINQANIGAQEAINAQNLAYQEQFAKSGIQWRVQDAIKAGINPLAALGAQTASFSNLVAPQSKSSDSAGTGVAAAGQDLSRAISATRTSEEQAVAIEKTRLDLESSQLDNDLKRASLASSLARTSGAHVGPGLDKGHELTTLIGPNGMPITGPSRESEGWSWLDPWAKGQYAVRNQVLPAFGINVPDKEKRAGTYAFKDPATGWFYHIPDASHASRAARGLWDRFVGPRGYDWLSRGNTGE